MKLVTLSPRRTSEAPGAQAGIRLRPGYPWHPTPTVIFTLITPVSDATRVPWIARTYVSGACLVQDLAKTQLGATTFCPLARCAAPPATRLRLPHDQPSQIDDTFPGEVSVDVCDGCGKQAVPGVPPYEDRHGDIRISLPIPRMQNTTAEKEKTLPIWTDTINGVEVSFYRNTIKGKTLPIYKVSRKKWYEKDGKWEFKYSLDLGEAIIAHELEARAMKDIGDYARKERAKLMAEKKTESEPVEEMSAPPMME